MWMHSPIRQFTPLQWSELLSSVPLAERVAIAARASPTNHVLWCLEADGFRVSF